MAIEFTVFKGSSSGEIVEAKGRREAGPTEVLVKISHSGVCGSDEHYRHVDQGLGHEGVGIITEVGSLVSSISEFKVGDRVGMGWWHRFCGYCKPCVTGKSLTLGFLTEVSLTEPPFRPANSVRERGSIWTR